MFSFSEFQALSMVAKRRNFRRAAAELNISASTLSHQVKQLEKQLGVRLLNRTTRSVSLTDAGVAFLKRIEPALAEISAAFESVNDFRENPNGQIRINTSAEAGSTVLIPYIQKYVNLYRHVTLDVVSESRLIDIVKEGFDFGIRSSDLVAKDMIAVPIGPRKVSFAVVGSPSYFKKFGMPKHPNDLLKHQCLKYRMGSGTIYLWEFEQRGKKIRVDVPGSLIIDNDSIAMSAALAGIGLSFQNEWSVAQAIKQGRLLRCLEAWTPSYPALSLYYPSARNSSAAAKAFVQLVKTLPIHD